MCPEPGVGKMYIEPNDGKYRKNPHNGGKEDAFTGDFPDFQDQFLVGLVEGVMMRLTDGKTPQVV
jgi:hypothetical protein